MLSKRYVKKNTITGSNGQVIGLSGVQFRENQASNFKLAEGIVWGWFEIMSTSELYDMKSNYQLIISKTKSEISKSMWTCFYSKCLGYTYQFCKQWRNSWKNPFQCMSLTRVPQTCRYPIIAIQLQKVPNGCNWIPRWLRSNYLANGEFPFTHSCAYMTHKNLKGRSLFHASASQGRTEACSFQSHLSA